MMDARIDRFYHGLNIAFYIDQIKFVPLNIAYECFHRSMPSHSHSSNSYEIHYIAHGKGTVTIERQIYTVGPGTLYITGPHVEHSQIPDPEDPMGEYCIYLKLEHKSAKSTGSGHFIALFHQTPFWFGQDRQNIHAVMKELLYELEHQNTGFLLMAEACLKKLILCIIRNYEISNEIDAPPAPVKPVVNLAESNYLIIEECFLYEYKDLTLEKLAARLGLGIRQTERLLLKYYGKKFQQMKNAAKLSAACILLKESQKTITEISTLLGYSSIEHFSHSFKQHYGLSPSQYRKM